MNLLALRLVAVFFVGVCLGSFVNWAIYALAWTPRPISPWSRLPARIRPATPVGSRADIWLVLASGAKRRSTAACFGCGRCCWKLGWALALALLYWWEVARLSLIQPQVGTAADRAADARAFICSISAM